MSLKSDQLELGDSVCGGGGGHRDIVVKLQFDLNVFFLFVIFIYFPRFGFKSEICLLIAPFPIHCFSITFMYGFPNN